MKYYRYEVNRAMSNTNTYSMEVKAFKFNKSGVCLNPNVIFKTTNKNVRNGYPDQTQQSFTIKTAKTEEGTWCYGITVCGRDFSYCSPCSKNSWDTFESERAAILSGISDIKRELDYARKHNTDATPAYEPALRKLLAEVRLENIQLSIF